MADIERKQEHKPEGKESRETGEMPIEELRKLKAEIGKETPKEIGELKKEITAMKEEKEMEGKLPEEEKEKNPQIQNPKISDIQRKDGLERSKTHPGEANVQRVMAGANIAKDLDTPQTNVIARFSQRVLKKMGI